MGHYFQPFGQNDLPAHGTAESGRTLITEIPFDDMLDIQAGVKSLYIFMIVKYHDENHDVLLTKVCISYKNNGQLTCDGHNETP